MLCRRSELVFLSKDEESAEQHSHAINRKQADEGAVGDRERTKERENCGEQRRQTEDVEAEDIEEEKEGRCVVCVVLRLQRRQVWDEDARECAEVGCNRK